MNVYPHQLSGGLRQRVMLAMAVAGKPDLIIADEPTTALDVTVQAQILSMLQDLRDEVGCSILLITHDFGVASQVADRIAVLYGGRLAEYGQMGEVTAQPSHPYTAGLLNSRLDLDLPRDRHIATLKGEPPDPRNHPPGCAFAPRCPHRMDICDESAPEARNAHSHDGVVACFLGTPAAAGIRSTEVVPLGSEVVPLGSTVAPRGAASEASEHRRDQAIPRQVPSAARVLAGEPDTANLSRASRTRGRRSPRGERSVTSSATGSATCRTRRPGGSG
jgi:peptide/nickel transport system ATP-binding protein